MANVDQLRGFWPIRHLTGGEIRTNEYTVTTSAAIFKGDLVSAINTGCVSASTAADGWIVVGVAAEYVSAATSATAGTKIKVYDDPNIIFGIQCVTGTVPDAASIFLTCDHLATTGNTTTGLSKHEANIGGTDIQLRILRLVDEPGNIWGEHADVEVIINEHLLRGIVSTGGAISL